MAEDIFSLNAAADQNYPDRADMNNGSEI